MGQFSGLANIFACQFGKLLLWKMSEASLRQVKLVTVAPRCGGGVSYLGQFSVLANIFACQLGKLLLWKMSEASLRQVNLVTVAPRCGGGV